MTNFDFSTNKFTSRLNNVIETGINKWMCSCPCTANHKHGDKKRSLSVAFDPVTENILVKCQTGCSTDDVLEAAGCSYSDLTMHETQNSLMQSVTWYANKNNYCVGDIYQYGDGLFKIRFYEQNGDKTFRWVHADNTSKFGYKWNRTGYKPRLYIAGNLKDKIIIVTEGEKDANTFRRISGKTAVSAENGATKGEAEKKWFAEYNEQLTDKDVYILYDLDEAGIKFAKIEADNLTGKANTVKFMNIRSVWPECPEKGDITDMAVALGDEETKNRIDQLFTSATSSIPVELINDNINDEADQTNKLPSWLIESVYNGRTTKKINEPMFCDQFKNANKLIRINNVFYLKGKQVSDEYVLSQIQTEIRPYFIERTGRITKDLFVTLQNACFIEQPAPDESKIYCADDITLTIDQDGNITANKEDIFTLTRLAVKYDPSAQCPTFIKYLNDLLYAEDIPAVQEYFGYCLIPSTRAQAGLFIHGKGGEGKSVLRDVVMCLFGHAAIQEGIHKLTDRFVLANLVNRLICVDDDMRTSLLSDTGTLKQLITNAVDKPLQVERKNQQKFDAFIYARVFALGNSFIGSKFDHSDGFYRRQLLIDCKPKTRPEAADDRFMGEKVCSEMPGILNWALTGLARLIKNNYHFTVSSRMKYTLDDVKHEGDNTLSFFEDDSVIKLTDDFTDMVSSSDLFTAYALWCFDNAETPTKKRSFLNKIGERYKDLKTKIPSETTTSRVNGYKGILLSYNMQDRIRNLDEKTTDRIRRLP